jgi:hypothetical protein
VRPSRDTGSARSAARTRAALWLAAAALAGQLATVADQLFVAHVTCLAHGERIHAANEGPARLAARWTEIGAAATESPADAHAQCLLDDDVDCVPAAGPAAPPLPRVAARPERDAASARPLPRQPLYRLAPKNSPPAQVA